MALLLIPLEITPAPFFLKISLVSIQLRISSIYKSVQIPDHFLLVCLAVWLPQERKGTILQADCWMGQRKDSPVLKRFKIKFVKIHCVKSVQIRENTDQKKLRIWTLFTQCWKNVDVKIHPDYNCESYEKFNVLRWYSLNIHK